MGQVLLDPLSVFGWDWETELALERDAARALRASRAIVVAAPAAARFKPEKLIDSRDADRRRAPSSTR